MMLFFNRITLAYKLGILSILIIFSPMINVFSQNIELVQPVKLLALGDSYTIGESVDEKDRWPMQLFSRLGESVETDDVQIIAKTGWRTDQLIKAVTEENPINFNFVTLLIGVNNQYQGRPIAEMKRDFECLLREALTRAGGEKNRVLVVSIPDYAYTPFGQTKSPDKISKELDEFNAWQALKTKEEDIAYLSITEISRQGLTDPELVAKDGLHPSGKQYGLWVDLIMKTYFN